MEGRRILKRKKINRMLTKKISLLIYIIRQVGEDGNAGEGGVRRTT